MTKIYFPFDSGAGADSYEARWSKMAEHWLATGVIAGELNQLEVFGDSSGMQVKVKSGKAWVKGHFFESDAQETLAIAAADPANPRIDRVIVRVDWDANTVDLAVLQGTPAVAPGAPALTQNTSRWEISLAQVQVDAAAATIAAEKVTDERVYALPGLTSSTPPADPTKLPNAALADGVGAITRIAEVVVGAGGAASIDFTSIPQIYRHLRLILAGRGTRAAASVTIKMRYNGDSGTNYDMQEIYAAASVVAATESIGASWIAMAGLAAASSPAGIADMAVVDVPNYKDTTFQKVCESKSTQKVGTASGNCYVQDYVGWWRNTAAINQITLLPASDLFAEGTRATLYGLL